MPKGVRDRTQAPVVPPSGRLDRLANAAGMSSARAMTVCRAAGIDLGYPTEADALALRVADKLLRLVPTNDDLAATAALIRRAAIELPGLVLVGWPGADPRLTSRHSAGSMLAGGAGWVLGLGSEETRPEQLRGRPGRPGGRPAG